MKTDEVRGPRRDGDLSLGAKEMGEHSIVPESGKPGRGSERERLETLRRYEVLDTPEEDEFEEIVRLAAVIGRMPMALVSLLDRDRQWFKAQVGVGVRETPIEQSFCRHALLEREVLVVPDARLDWRFRDNPLVTGEMGLRAYAGAVLRSEDGVPFGTLCVLDREPRQFEPEVLEALKVLGHQVVQLLELRLARKRLRNTIDSLEGAFVVVARDGVLIEANALAREILSGGERMVGENFRDAFRLGDASPLAGVIERVLKDGGSMSALEFFHDASGRWLGCEVYPAPDGVLLHLRDVTRKRAQEHRLRDLSDDLAQKVREMDFLHLVWDLLQKGSVEPRQLADDLARGAAGAMKRGAEVVVEVAHGGVIRRSAEMGARWGEQVREGYRTESGMEGWVVVAPAASVREGDRTWLGEAERWWLRRLVAMLQGDAERREKEREREERMKALWRGIERSRQAMWLCEKGTGRVVDANAEARQHFGGWSGSGVVVEWRGESAGGGGRERERLEGILRDGQGREIRVREMLMGEEEDGRYLWVGVRPRWSFSFLRKKDG